jgi:fatty-acyl-CoA synthase
MGRTIVTEAHATSDVSAADVSKDWVRANAERFGEALALQDVETGERWTWWETDRRVGALAGVLRHRLGVDIGDRVVVLADGDPRTFELQFACIRLGAVLVPLNWRLATAELIELTRDVEPTVLVSDDVHLAVAEQLAVEAGVRHHLGWRCPPGRVADYEEELGAATPVEPRADLSVELAALLLHTSGTTGSPKAALNTVKSLTWHTFNVTAEYGLHGPGTLMLNPMPLFHAGGLTTVATPMLINGGAIATMRRFEAERIAALLGAPENGFTHFIGAPVMWQMLADAPSFATGDFSAMRFAQVAAGSPSPQLLARWTERGVTIRQAYGGTEMGPAVTSMPAEAVTGRPDSCGRAVPFTHVRLVGEDGADVHTGEVGEVWIKGPAVFPGYRRKDGSIDPARTPDGWFRTGDAAWRDAAGFLHLVDRIKDMYKSGGENVVPAEVERALASHPDVEDVAVVGVPDPTWGEVGRAFVVARPDTALTLEVLRAHCERTIARYKAPRSLVLLDHLPRNGTGKVVRAELRAHDPEGEGSAG